MKARQVMTFSVLGLGIAMLLYGLAMHVQPVYSKDNDKGLATVETALIKEVTIGGLERKEDGTLHKTYSGAPPKACPT